MIRTHKQTIVRAANGRVPVTSTLAVPSRPDPAVRIRPLDRSDAATAVDAVFAGLSPRSRYLRFHSPVPRLTAEVRAALVDLDGRSRAAVVAEAWDGTDRWPIGIARLADAGGGRADLAIAVVDAWHRRGVGRRLLAVLRDLAADLGYAELSGDVLPENAAMLALARRMFPLSRPAYADGVVRVGGPLGAAAFTLTHEDLLADLLGR